jgi:hypothetical protein
MSKNIFEELPSRQSGEVKPGADAAAGIEKKARQLVYDARYEVKKILAGKRADPASQERMVLERIAKSTAIPAVKTRARQMVSKKAAVAEDFIPKIEDAAATNIAKAMFKVFVEGVEEIIPDYLEELHGLDDKKYKIRVTDPKTGNSYVRYGTREKITQLRSKGLKVEMTEYGEPREGERKRGEETASATGGGGRAKKDYDGDGKVESGAKEYRGVVHNAIQRRKGGSPDGKDTSGVREEFLADGTDSTEGQNKLKITGKGVDNYASGVVKISPEDGTQTTTTGPKNVYAHTELEGEVLSEKAKSRAQQKFMGMVYVRKKGKMKKGEASPEVEAAAKGMTKKEAKKYAKTKHKGLPEKVEEATDCGPTEIERDTRGDYAKVNLIKNKLRAKGAKDPITVMAASYEPEGDQIDEVAPLAIGAGMAAAAAAPYLLKKFVKPVVDKAIDKPATGSGGLIDKMKQRRDAINQSYEPKGDLVDGNSVSAEMSLEDYIIVNRDGTRTRVPGEPPRIQGPMPKIKLSPALKDNPYRPRPGESD